MLSALAFGFAGSGPAATSTGYVALGDSYSSGVGTGSYTLNSACKRSVYAYPYLYTQRHAGTSLTFVACSGAKTSDVLATQVQSVTKSTTLVTMTIGGNDLRTVRGENWPETLVRCITSNGCDGSEKNQIANLEQMRADLTAAYTSIGESYPDISVRVLGYPRLMQSDRWCEGVTGFSRGEADWVDDQVDRFNAVIAAAVRSAADATGADIAFVSVVEQFDNHGACRFWNAIATSTTRSSARRSRGA